MTEKVINAVRWIFHNFFLITIAVFIVIYLRWFRLTPLVFEYYNDPNAAYIIGLILLNIYGVSAAFLKRTKNRKYTQTILFVSTVLLLFVNYIFTRAYVPSIIDTTKCDRTTYYVLYNHPFPDYNWTHYQITKWKGLLDYESFFFGYVSTGGDYEIICDNESREVNIVDNTYSTLVYTDGVNSLRFDRYTGILLNNHRYFITDECNDWIPSHCGSFTHRLYECNLDYKACNPLPIKYTNEDDLFIQLEANEVTNEIKLIEYGLGSENEILIFTYGEHPRCYVEGCEILEQK